MAEGFNSGIESEVYERLVRLEVVVEKLEANFAYHLERNNEVIAAHTERLDDLNNALTRYRGLVGGILLAITAVGTFIKTMGSRIMEILT